MGVSAVSAWRPHGESKPQRSLFAEAHVVQATWLAIQHGIASNLWKMLEQIAGTPRPKGLFIRHGGERQTSVQSRPQSVKKQVSEDRRRGSRLHVAGAAAIYPTVDQLSAPGVNGPSPCLPHREDIDVTI